MLLPRLLMKDELLRVGVTALLLHEIGIYSR